MKAKQNTLSHRILLLKVWLAFIFTVIPGHNLHERKHGLENTVVHKSLFATYLGMLT